MKGRARSASARLRWAARTDTSAVRRTLWSKWRKRRRRKLRKRTVRPPGGALCATKDNDGTESSSIRLQAGIQQALALALVLERELSAAPAGRSRTQGRPPQAAEIRRHQFD